MKRIAIYGKGGIGKSTTASNVAAALAKRGLTVMQIGCDPKADSTRALTGGRPVTSVLDAIRKNGMDITLDEIVTRGDTGVLCVEAGGPTPGVGCAGRGIITAFEALERLDVRVPEDVSVVGCDGTSPPPWDRQRRQHAPWECGCLCP